MKSSVAAVFLFFVAHGSLVAQDSVPDTVVGTGVIRVTRKPISPYFKVEYTMTRMLDPVKAAKKNKNADSTAQPDNGDSGWKYERKKSDDEDSLTLERGAKVVFPTRITNISQHYMNEITYYYNFTDTPRVDTMHVGLWINTTGKIRQVYVREQEKETVPESLYDQVIGASLKLKKWDAYGGHWPRKRFLRKQKFVKDHFYCSMNVIIASFPMSLEQKTSGVRFTAKDVCLNEPPPPESRKKRRGREKTDGEESSAQK
ncbi:MAG: hypothetical protein FD123_3520 [Bacteroidetes bacterium]|nr:MAG: hypothetical protein FD123_3520 [Bacteroidota bacterium]